VSKFQALKKSSQSEFDKLTEKLNELNTKFQKDERFWELSVDKAGNGYATIRFLPRLEEEPLPFVRFWDHGFKGVGGWYIELSRTSLKDPDTGEVQADPVTEYNALRWEEGQNSPGRDFVSGKQGKPGSKRRLHYISNIYVINDPVHPENNGKVFLFQYGKRIFDKLNGLMNPDFEDKKKVNPFDLWTGVTFTIRAKKVDGQRNYNDSEWGTPGPLADDETMEKIYDQQYPLLPFLDEKRFKSYEELDRKLKRVLGTNSPTTHATVEAAIAQPKTESTKTATPAPKQDETPPWSTDDDDADIAAFEALVNK